MRRPAGSRPSSIGEVPGPGRHSGGRPDRHARGDGRTLVARGAAAAPQPPAPGSPGEGRGARWATPNLSLATQAALAMAFIALLAVALAGVVSLQQVRRAAEKQLMISLGRQASVFVTTAESGRKSLTQLPTGWQRNNRLLNQQKISLLTVTHDGVVHGRRSIPIATRDIQRLLQKHDVNGVRDIAGHRMFVAGRPALDGGVLLVQDAGVARPVARADRQRTLVALLVGLLGAALVGMLLARRLARPLQRAAAEARRMATGARDVRLSPRGPTEVAELADALNTLAGALTASEGRQREFLLSVSHELRTPLTAVRGFAEALSDGVIAGPDVPGTGATMVHEADRLERLVSDLLDLARLGAQDFRIDLTQVDVTALVRQAGAVWTVRCAREDVRLRLELPDHPVVVRTDATRVRQIVDGLAENALRVVPAGAPIVFHVEPEGAGVAIAVRDGGPGLTAQDREVAFERSELYQRYRGIRRVGTGLGLAIVAGLTARLGGRPEVATAPEGGACFAIHLPGEFRENGQPPADRYAGEVPLRS